MMPKRSTEYAVMGVDPGVTNTGVTVMDLRVGQRPKVLALELVSTPKATKKAMRNTRVLDDDQRRMRLLWDTLTGLVEMHDVKAIAVEAYNPRPGIGSNAWKTIMAYQTACCVAWHYDLALLPFLPLDLKNKIVGKKDATKEEVLEAVASKVIGFDIKKFAKTKREHIGDSAGHAYLACLEITELRKLLGKQRRV